jgi:hypothetical protein
MLRVKDSPEIKPDAVVHALANALNDIFIVAQLQERYLAKDAEQMRQLLLDTTKDLKNAVENVQCLIDQLRESLKQRR